MIQFTLKVNKLYLRGAKSIVFIDTFVGTHNVGTVMLTAHEAMWYLESIELVKERANVFDIQYVGNAKHELAREYVMSTLKSENEPGFFPEMDEHLLDKT